MITSSRSIRSFLIAAVLVTGVVTASGQEKEKAPSATALKKYDKNADGTLDASENAARQADLATAKATREEAMKKYDANQDGKLDTEEKALKKSEEKAAKAALKAAKKKEKAASVPTPE